MRFFRGLGIGLQVLVLGELLLVALVVMHVVDTGGRVFRYAGF